MSCTGVQDRSERRDRNNHLSKKERLREKDLNLRPSGYEPNELTILLHPAFAIVHNA